MDTFLVLGFMLCTFLAWQVIWGFVRLSMSWQGRASIVSIYAVAGVALFSTLQHWGEPAGAWIMAALYGGAALLVLTINDPTLQLMDRVAEEERRPR